MSCESVKTVFADRFVVVVPLFMGRLFTEETGVVVFFHNMLIQKVYIKVWVDRLVVWVNNSFFRLDRNLYIDPPI